jgi:hypothetical protein
MTVDGIDDIEYFEAEELRAEEIVHSGFGRAWPKIPDHLRDELLSLEREGAIYTTHWIEEIGDFRKVRIRFTEDEIKEFVRRMWCYELFLQAGSPARAVTVEGIHRDVADTADAYSITFPDGKRVRPWHCPAAFLGPHLEALTCLTSRDEVIALMRPEVPVDLRLAALDQAISEGSTRRAAEVLDRWLAEGESQTLEFKREINNPRDIAHEIAAFGTSGGGVLLVGVDDEGKVTGFADSRERVEGICSTVQPPPPVSIMLLELRGLPVLCVRVFGGFEPVCYVDGKPYIRVGTLSRPANHVEVKELILSKAR